MSLRARREPSVAIFLKKDCRVGLRPPRNDTWGLRNEEKRLTMFTGIIEEIGTIENIAREANLIRLAIRAKKITSATKLGDSTAIDGVCLTVTRKTKSVLRFDVVEETLLKTTLGALHKGSRVNLERALLSTTRISGHFVTGHIDGVGAIIKKVTKDNYVKLEIAAPKNLYRYIVPKGSIAIDGISLTVGEVKKNYFAVYLIPFTERVTTIGFKKKGDRVNIETDMLAKYVAGQKRK